MLELGIEDGFDTAITLIEWPDKMGSYLPEEYLKITLSMAEHEGARHIKLTCTDYWTLKLKDFEVQYEPKRRDNKVPCKDTLGRG